MQLTDVEKQRTGLLQFLIVLIMIFLALIMIISYNQGLGYSILALTLLALAACLYVVAKERNLKELDSTLRRNLVKEERKVARLDMRLAEEQHELEEEKGRSSDIDLRLREITGLYRAISTVNAVSDPGKTYETVLRAALDLVGADRGSIMLLNEERNRLFIASAHGLDESVIKRTSQTVGEGIAGHVAQTGEPVLVSGRAEEDDRFSHPTVLRE
ncbi:MAG: GAF domain-containing protein, partial [Acidobacteria bacterium]|nr:GAF domain-containing protein [Acidobacteriota bacterium]